MNEQSIHTRSKTVTIKTDYGTEATYIIGLYDGIPGFVLLRRLTQMTTPAAGVIDTLIRAVAKTVEIDGMGDGDQARAFEAVLKNLDAAGIDGILRDLIKGIADEGDASLMIQILSCVVSRQSIGPNGEREQLQGMTSASFNHLFRGNYGEMIRACYHCVEHNYGPALRAFASGNVLVELAGGVLDRLKAQQSSDTASA